MLSKQSLEFAICDAGFMIRKHYNYHAGKLGLSALDRRALIYIDHYCGLTQIELASYLEIEAQNLIRVLDRLVEMNYIVKTVHPKDRRAKCLTLSQEGKQVLDQLNAEITKTYAQTLKGISEAEQEQTFEVLQKLKANLQAALDECQQSQS